MYMSIQAVAQRPASTQQPILHRFHLPITDEETLRQFVRVSWGVDLPDIQVCPEHTTPWRAFCDAYFAGSSVVVWKASRGFGGKSYLLALLGLTEAATLKADVNVLGGSGLQSERVHDYMQQFWRHKGAPRHLLASDPIKRETRLRWGNHIKALMASMSSVRGPHPQRLRLDEIDEMDLKILQAAQGQPMGKAGIQSQTVMSSTHHHADGTMTYALNEANQRGWPVYEWCYRESMAQPGGWLDEIEVERKKTEVTKYMWDAEYDLQEPSPESRAIQPEKVAAMFDKSLGHYTGSNNEYIEIEPPMVRCSNLDCRYEMAAASAKDLPGCPKCKEPLRAAKYATGADWARKQDWTIIITFRTDIKPIKLVAFKRMGRMPWPVMVEEYNQRVLRYGGSGAHDGTGLGDVVDGYIKVSNVEPIVMVGRARSDMLSEYINGVERGEIVAPFIDFMEAEHRLASVDDVYGSGHLPDTIAAGSLGYHARVTGVFFK